MKSLKRGLTLLLLVALLIPATGYAQENTASGITRVEFAAWINQVFQYINEGEWNFRDQDVNESPLSELRKAVAAGYMQGYGDGTLRPYQTNVSVHDPSVIKDASTYYVFGSHIDAAKSADLQNWTKFTNGYTTPGNVIYGDLSENLADSFKWAGEDDADSKGGYAVWAPDVIWNKYYKNPDGTTGAFMQYYSASSTYIRSAIGFAVSQNIEGPYLYGDTVVFSGFTLHDARDDNSTVNKKWTQTHLSELIEAGLLNGENLEWFKSTGEYNNTIYPNAIDATLFFDKEGKLWMTYGSWSGGIFLLELDPETGLPKYPGQDGVTEDGRLIDRYFGVKIAGGFTKSGEGPYIFYDPSTDYYYLNVTYGWLGADGGYNMRQFRASSPTGPYLDASGQNAVLTDQNTANDLIGIKLMGNFLFKQEIGETGPEDGYGYVSPGHNSVFYDEAAGKYFLLFHTRFPERGEAHELRVHQMFMNKDGWLVTAPGRYSGETAAAVKEASISGDYKFVNHGLSYSGAVTESVSITLEKDKKITGDLEGSWSLEGGYDAEIVVNGEAYHGVFVQGWDPLQQQNTLTFTAVSAKGETIWGIKQPDITDQQAVIAVEQALSLGDTSRVTDHLQLPVKGVRGTKIEWVSSDPSVISDAGVISPPDPGEEPLIAELTAVITKGAFSAAKKFQVRVIPLDLNEGLAAHYAFEGDLSDSTDNYEHGKVTGPLIDEQNGNGNIAFSKGVTGNAAVFDGESGIRLPDGLISGNEYSVSLWVYPKEHNQFSTTFFGAQSKSSWISLVPDSWDNHTMLWSGEAWYDGSTGSRIRTKDWHHLAFIVNEGSVKVFVNGEQKYTGKGFPDIFKDQSGIFSLGVNWWDRPFEGKMDELRIYNTSLTDALVKRLSQEASFEEEEGKAELAAKFLFEHDLADHAGNFGSGEIIGSQLASP
ncbi:LamG-like jellyroll fold domain-containing protein [Paenibacillus antibioticophila]|uniref:LamG-like jellyroll fold domain-containing protein n=1 Tax=Paenibacillus antibioticophila TaxID=1274374 RepID=UPI0008FEED47|nr:LamG-like jellyroll fold domain-containing protein [Paenibacillus antibioticophila]